MTFDFRKDPGSGNIYTLDLGITNTFPAAATSSGTLVVFAFNEPLRGNGSEATSLLSHPLSSGYGRVFGNTDRGIRIDPQQSINSFNLRTASCVPCGNIDFCARTSSRSGCHGASGSTSIAGGTTLKIQLLPTSNELSIATTDQTAEHFYNLLNSLQPGNRRNKAQIALRFQNVKNPNGSTELRGKEFTGTAFWQIPDKNPTKKVLAPLSLLEAATAFG